MCCCSCCCSSIHAPYRCTESTDSAFESHQVTLLSGNNHRCLVRVFLVLKYFVRSTTQAKSPPQEPRPPPLLSRYRETNLVNILSRYGVIVLFIKVYLELEVRGSWYFVFPLSKKKIPTNRPTIHPQTIFSQFIYLFIYILRVLLSLPSLFHGNSQSNKPRTSSLRYPY